MSAPRHVLYLVDNQDHCELVQYQLRGRGIEVASSRSVAETAKAAEVGRFDLYLLDNAEFADGTGRDACRHIRSIDPNIPILFYSARAYPKEIDAALAAGADDYITLPDMNCVLPDRIAALLCLIEMRSREAKQLQVHAISAELSEESARADEGSPVFTVEVSQTELHYLKSLASNRFVKAGGTRASFERMWPEILEGAVERSLLLRSLEKPYRAQAIIKPVSLRQ